MSRVFFATALITTNDEMSGGVVERDYRRALGPLFDDVKCVVSELPGDLADNVQEAVRKAVQTESDYLRDAVKAIDFQLRMRRSISLSKPRARAVLARILSVEPGLRDELVHGGTVITDLPDLRSVD